MYTFAIWRLAWCLLPAAILAAPPTTRSPSNLEKDSTLIHSADHDVTSLGVIFDQNDKQNNTIFFIESNINEQGERIDFGLYALKNGVKTKLLDNAKDIAIENLETAYFATKDGIYFYNKQTNSAQKYGVINDDVIALDTENGTGTLYYLNKEHQLYKVTENGRKFTIIDAVKNAQDIATDQSGHLVYRSNDRSFYVYDGSTIRKVEGIPVETKKSWLVKAPIFAENHVFLYANDNIYAIETVNATVQAMSSEQAVQKPPGLTAIFTDPGLVYYYAKDKKIYELNILEKIVRAIFEEIGKKIKHKLEELRNVFNPES